MPFRLFVTSAQVFLWIWAMRLKIGRACLEFADQIWAFLRHHSWELVLSLVLVWGFNYLIWGLIGLVRSILEFLFLRINLELVPAAHHIKKTEVAVIMPAHNEELVIADSIRSLLQLTDPAHIFIVSDGSTDRTADLAVSFGVNVLVNFPGKGKAGALESGIRHFNLLARYKAIVLVDADTRLRADYLENALFYLRDKRVIAVAGYAMTIWNPGQLSAAQKFVILYRDRLYYLYQMLVKFGQTWGHTNVTAIIPGFASIYRTSALRHITMNPPGLVIEDFNMTFEVHHKRLGTITHHSNVVGFTQDPDNLHDYYKQITRWHLGFWQTIKLHGLWTSKFWVAMVLLLFEVIVGNVLFLITPLFLLVLGLSHLIPGGLGLGAIFEFVFRTPFLKWILWGFWLPDYILTIITAIGRKRPEYLWFGLGFIAIRFLDAAAFLKGMVKAFTTKSSGRWVSPTRRAG